MELTTIVSVLIVTGFLLWLINRLIAMPPIARKIANAVVIITVIFWLLRVIVILLS